MIRIAPGDKIIAGLAVDRGQFPTPQTGLEAGRPKAEVQSHQRSIDLQMCAHMQWAQENDAVTQPVRTTADRSGWSAASTRPAARAAACATRAAERCRRGRRSAGTARPAAAPHGRAPPSGPPRRSPASGSTPFLMLAGRVQERLARVVTTPLMWSSSRTHEPVLMR